MECGRLVESLLDTDLYKLTMGQVVLHQFSDVNVRYKFKCRTKADWTEDHVKEINEQIEMFCSLKLTHNEEEYLRSIRFLKDSYVDFLKLYKPDSRHVSVWVDKNGELQIEVAGPWFLTIYWEVPLLAIVSEVYSGGIVPNGAREALASKVRLANRWPIQFSEFGTRRRRSGDWQDFVVWYLRENASRFAGTSNVMLAMRYGLTPIGTMAHEFIQVGQALDVMLRKSQKRMLQAWVDEYRGDLGIALTDTIGIDAFLKDFDLYFAKLYDGLRHDSGDPIEWTEKVMAHYDELCIGMEDKTLIYSDGITFQKAEEIMHRFDCDWFGPSISFGIGTNLTNDFDDGKTLQIVMKVIEANGQPVAKISDNPKKIMCEDERYVDFLRSVFDD